MWEWLKQGKNLQGLGSLVGGVGSIYGGIQQGDAANKMINLSEDELDFNKKLLLADEESKKRERAAYNRAYGTGVVAL